MKKILLKLLLFIGVCFTFTLIYLFLEDSNFVGFSSKVKNDNSRLNKVINRFYFSIICGSTIGFGDMHPRTNIAKLLVICQILLLFLIICI